MSFKEIVAETFQVEESVINDDLKYQQIEAWDSLNHLDLVSQLEETYDIELDMDEVISMESIARIKEILREHGVSEDELC